jgi:hypothetical protein
MPQPANKRFVMEDKLTTDLALKANILNPTFTGTINTGTGGIISNGNIYTDWDIDAPIGAISGGTINSTFRILSNSTDAITNASTSHAIQAGPETGLNVRLGNDGTDAAVQAVNNGVYSNLDINGLGGNVHIGSASTTTSVLGTFTPPRGFMLVSRDEYISSPANFTKASFPWLRAIKVVCVGGGGGAGGAAITGAAQNAIGQAGAGAAYAETFITDIAGLGASIAMTVGAGGTAGAAGGAGGTGGDTSFGTLCVAKGGTAGGAGAATAVGSFAGGVSAAAQGLSTGDIVYAGGNSGFRQYAYAASVARPIAGNSAVAPIGVSTVVVTTTGAGATFSGYGTGGLPGVNAQNQAAAVAGAAGSGGYMIVELYA